MLMSKTDYELWIEGNVNRYQSVVNADSSNCF
jgi:hypothetical protein